MDVAERYKKDVDEKRKAGYTALLFWKSIYHTAGIANQKI